MDAGVNDASPDGVLPLPAEVGAKYEVVGKVGEGAFGIVLHARRRRRRRRREEPVALKRCVRCLDSEDEYTLRCTFREIALLRRLTHESIVPLRDAMLPAAQMDLFLTFDLADMDLACAIRSCLVGEAEQRLIVCQLLRALKYLHAAHVIHRDVKPANVLLDRGCQRLRLCDFGLARLVGPYPRGLTQFVGMRWYCAPELLLGSQRYSDRVDIWALGCVIGEVVLGRPLLQGISPEEQLALQLGLVLGRSPDELEAELPGLPEEAVARFAQVEPAGELLGTRFADPEVLDFLRLCLQLSPDSRPGARELLAHRVTTAHRREDDDLQFMESVELPLPETGRHSPQAYREAIAREVEALAAADQGGDSCSSCSSSSGGSVSGAGSGSVLT